MVTASSFCIGKEIMVVLKNKEKPFLFKSVFFLEIYFAFLSLENGERKVIVCLQEAFGQIIIFKNQNYKKK